LLAARYARRQITTLASNMRQIQFALKLIM
jgi:hypothetical protein